MKTGARNQLIFGVFAAVVVGAVSLISALMLGFERDEAASRREAKLQEAIRVAIARMEARLSPLLTREAARPYFHYASFYGADEAYTRMLRPVDVGDVLVPSPLLSASPEFCRLHFQIGADGTFTSPRVPSGNLLDIAEMSYVSGADVLAAANALEDLRGRIEGPELVATMCGESPPTNTPDTGSWRTAEPGIELGTMTPRWIDRNGTPELVIVRSLVTPGTKFVQGVWLEWPSLRAALLEEAADVLPAARLERATTDSGGRADDGGTSHTLASLPVTLVPGEVQSAHASGLSPTRVMLAIAWIAVLMSIGAVGFIVRTLADVGERRGRFVSAVTHELRTPLTTFRMYAHMLADGTAREGAVRQEMAETLRTESDRLQRVVESVLSYARLSDSAARPDLQRIEAREAIDTILPVLERCACEHDMQIESSLEGLDGAEILADIQSLERALVNLVDNACRYAGGAPETTDRHIRILTARHPDSISVSVADHGPGVSSRDRKRLFKPFATARGQGGKQTGLGLGLALARELIRQHGGDLDLETEPTFGAVFTITLPLA